MLQAYDDSFSTSGSDAPLSFPHCHNVRKAGDMPELSEWKDQVLYLSIPRTQPSICNVVDGQLRVDE